MSWRTISRMSSAMPMITRTMTMMAMMILATRSRMMMVSKSVPAKVAIAATPSGMEDCRSLRGRRISWYSESTSDFSAIRAVR